MYRHGILWEWVTLHTMCHWSSPVINCQMIVTRDTLLITTSPGHSPNMTYGECQHLFCWQKERGESYPGAILRPTAWLRPLDSRTPPSTAPRSSQVLLSSRWYCQTENNTCNIYIHTISPKYLVWNTSWYHCIALLLCPCKVGWYAGMLLCTTARVTRPHLPSQPCTPRHPYSHHPCSHHPTFLCKYFHEYIANILKFCRYADIYSPTLDDYVFLWPRIKRVWFLPRCPTAVSHQRKVFIV